MNSNYTGPKQEQVLAHILLLYVLYFVMEIINACNNYVNIVIKIRYLINNGKLLQALYDVYPKYIE